MLKIVVNLFYKPVEALKQFLSYNSDLYLPINGGSTLKNDNWCQQNVKFDDIGENISKHNKLLNENTSIYWFWKHLNEFEPISYIGFNHYRRFFSRSILDIYKSFDIIVAQPIKCIYSLEWQYDYYHNANDLKKCINILKDIDFNYGFSFEQYMKQKHDNFAPMNMFTMSKIVFNDWCSFIFPVLFRLEKAINIIGRDNYQKRAICFLEERIFGHWVWLKKNNDKLKVFELPIVEHLDWKNNLLNERGTYDE